MSNLGSLDQLQSPLLIIKDNGENGTWRGPGADHQTVQHGWKEGQDRDPSQIEERDGPRKLRGTAVALPYVLVRTPRHAFARRQVEMQENNVSC